MHVLIITHDRFLDWMEVDVNANCVPERECNTVRIVCRQTGLTASTSNRRSAAITALQRSLRTEDKRREALESAGPCLSPN